jgi:AraC-like DNA-binding protein
MKIETFYPRDECLKNVIEYYYFLKSDSPDFNSEYYAFPNIYQALNIHKDIKYEIGSHSIKVSGIKENNFTMLLQGRRDIPLFVSLSGKINKITIIFKPLGLNHFITSPFSTIASNPTQVFTEWNYYEKNKDFLINFFTEINDSKRIDILEKHLLLHYCDFNNAELLKVSLNMLGDFNEELPIEEISRRINLKVRTFNRLFKTHMGISPCGYRKVARFRHSLNTKIFNSQFKNLTKIGYESNFYDQSYFIKMYKKLTNLPPAVFFKSIDKLADNHLIFKFVKH